MLGGGNKGNEGSREKERCAESKVYKRKSLKGLANVTDIRNNSNNNFKQQLPAQGLENSSSLNHIEVAPMRNHDMSKDVDMENLGGFPSQQNKVALNLSLKSKKEIRELRRKLEGELDLVKHLVKKIESKEGQKNGCGVTSGSPVVKRLQSDGKLVSKPRDSGPVDQLSVSVPEDSQGVADNMEKEKRTPKANQLYRNSEFLLGKDKIPPAGSNKKSKANDKKGGGGETVSGFGFMNFPSQVLKSCKALLEKLMKHKHGWVFNKPVDPVALGLHDYLDIIKHPMDLGTVKSKLDDNQYKSPSEFVEDVRLTFQNAMTYNPKGQDVHAMAEQLLKIFEDKWAFVEADYTHESRSAVDNEVAVPNVPKRTQPQLPVPNTRKVLEKSESTTRLADIKLKPSTGRVAAPKKPKARDPNKREMTYEEKQKLSLSLQNLPSEKLENVVQIIKKRNPSLCQNDDEIEVDIDSVDTETLWELDRFVTNYKKNASKNKRKAELADQAISGAEQNVQEHDPPATQTETDKEREIDEKVTSSPPAQVDKQGDNASRSSSSSTGSGSSSSGSDSEGSSG